jgi:hypothetical protein
MYLEREYESRLSNLASLRRLSTSRQLVPQIRPPTIRRRRHVPRNRRTSSAKVCGCCSACGACDALRSADVRARIPLIDAPLSSSGSLRAQDRHRHPSRVLPVGRNASHIGAYWLYPFVSDSGTCTREARGAIASVARMRLALIVESPAVPSSSSPSSRPSPREYKSTRVPRDHCIVCRHTPGTFLLATFDPPLHHSPLHALRLRVFSQPLSRAAVRSSFRRVHKVRNIDATHEISYIVSSTPCGIG